MGGRVLYRQGVTSTCPEGVGWLSVPTHTNREVSQVGHIVEHQYISDKCSAFNHLNRLLNLEHVELK